MNYRHAFHAGNFADCMKHALLVWMLRALARKAAGFMVLDTHAGVGSYDLDAGPAARTGEWQTGVARLLDATQPALADYLGLVRGLGLYPGSPALIRAVLRPQDSLICCELHPEDYAALRRWCGRDPQVAVHLRNGWEAVRAFLPPRERRGLVLIDPPYELPDEFARVTRALLAAQARFRGGVFAAWYPIKHRAPVREFHFGLRACGLRDVVAVELWLREALDPTRLNGCGLVVVNPPFGFMQAAPDILAALLDRLGEPGGGTSIEVLVGE